MTTKTENQITIQTDISSLMLKAEVVKRYNAHDTLVEACKKSQDYILRSKEYSIKKADCFSVTVAINEALKLAGN